MSNSKGYDVNSSAERSLTMNVLGITTECTDLVNGTAASFNRTGQEFTNTKDYQNKSHFFQSGDKSGNVVVNVLAGSRQDKIFTKLRRIQSSAPSNNKPMANFVYADNANGETATGTACIIQGPPQDDMANNIPTKAYTFLADEVDNDYDGVTDDIKQLLSE
ncbi:hypothetical protein MOO46_07575 (plasmid) [Apilactobacillus apisilvae]|uniref:Uncharacterized protein n=1 Tax=Apilactobacillus apisilvae TaxID=2923364 RepID=A0ABY4PJ48_9LACO|nr:hypothetical protein [Apilactobacillus apisilvae]UQS85784.1 hypothetical protein MOO46_07575 [Apilactobacillus apisilvae]